VHPTPQSAVGKADPQLAFPLKPAPSAMHSRVKDLRASTFTAENGKPMEHIQVGLPMATQVPDSRVTGIRAIPLSKSNRAPQVQKNA
jgi:hypothetical protein